MRWDFGQIYKQIRQSKGLTQAEVCGNEIARSTLANFETGISIPKFETMVFFLDQIDMSIEEFRYICHEFQPSERQSILYSLQNLPPYPNLETFEQLQNQCENYLTSHYDVPIKHLSDMLSIYILLYQGESIASSKKLYKATQKIWEYLEKQDTWYESDLRLLRTILHHFPIEVLPDITDKILESLKKYKNYRNIKPFQIALLTNLSNIYFHAGKTSDCEKIINLAIELAKQIKQYVYLGTGYIRLGICRGDDALIENGLALLRLTDERDMLTMLEEEVKKYR